MRVNLHSNIPYIPYIPNPALGYLKTYLSQEGNYEVKNIYWNLFTIDLYHRYIKKSIYNIYYKEYLKTRFLFQIK